MKKQSVKSFGEQMMDWRLEANLTQGAVSKKLNYSSPQFLSNWERNLSLPPMKVIPALAKIYKLDSTKLKKAIFEESHRRWEKRTLKRLGIEE